MSADTPLALALADHLESDSPEFDHCADAAAELRRLADVDRELQAQLKAAQADAQRYRWLRAQHEGLVAQSFTVFQPERHDDLDPPVLLGPIGCMPGELDAAIDAAMGGKEQA